MESVWNLHGISLSLSLSLSLSHAEPSEHGEHAVHGESRGGLRLTERLLTRLVHDLDHPDQRVARAAAPAHLS